MLTKNYKAQLPCTETREKIIKILSKQNNPQHRCFFVIQIWIEESQSLIKIVNVNLKCYLKFTRLRSLYADSTCAEISLRINSVRDL